MGARQGPSMMPGGDKAAWQYLQPVLSAIAAKVGNEPCVAYMGNNAAGHYVKMVHNGIEYAMMQMISEVYDLLHRAGGCDNKELHSIFSGWKSGQLQSFLIEVTAEVFRIGDNETTNTDDFLIDKILDQAGSKATGKWTSQEAMDLPVSIPTIDLIIVDSAGRNFRNPLYVNELSKVIDFKEEVKKFQQDYTLTFKKNYNNHNVTATAGFTTFSIT